MNVIPWNGQPISAPGIYSGVPIEVYHSADVCAGPSISSSGLRTIFAESPLDYWIYSPLNPHRLEQPEKEAFILGRAAHHLFLGEADFSKLFVLSAYEDFRTNESKDWKAAEIEKGRTVLTAAQMESIKGMAGLLPWQEGLEDCGLKNNALVRAGALQGLIEHTIIAVDPETGVFLKARPDVVPTDSLEYNDFKTTQDVSDEAIRRTLEDRRYDMQADLASFCLEHSIGERFSSVGFIFAAKKPPHAIGAAEPGDEDMAEAAKDNRAAIRTFARCIDTGRWPGPAGQRGDAAVIARSEWSRHRADTRRKHLEQELAA